VNAQIDIAVRADRVFSPARLLEFDLAARPRVDEDISAINQADTLPVTVDDLLGERERAADVAGLVSRLLQRCAELVYFAARGDHRLLELVDRFVVATPFEKTERVEINDREQNEGGDPGDRVKDAPRDFGHQLAQKLLDEDESDVGSGHRAPTLGE